MSAPIFTPETIRFLRALRRRNEKPWFEANRERYDQHVRLPLRELVEEVDVRLATLAPEIVGDAKRSPFRIHRDVRFSSDKSPYKTTAACWFFHRAAGRSVGTAREGGGAGFYFHIDPDEVLVAGGLWMPARPALDRVREAIAQDPDGFGGTVSGRAFRERFGGLTEEAMLVRMPRGYAPDHPAERWLRFRTFTASRTISEEEAYAQKLPDLLARDYAVLLPLVRWLNSALGYPPATRR